MTIADARCVWLTTLRQDGSPHTTPTWFLLRRNRFLIASSTVNLKVRNVVREPRVSLAIDGTAPDPWVAQGLATIHHDFDHFGDLVRLFADKYDGWDAADETQDGPRVLIAVEVTRWLLRPY
ncbi:MULTISPECIES: pyridoxamine 5'-phosphate oxidase family protein [Rhodococcus]|uniref:pyridoxamine 5'-phosphate oxidase family protein n=1 Tax=Rhodococcus TaxID=1827 RepID=UPI001D186AA9|nr:MULTISPECIES: pyridoxamine 5'-phosphate oxidase family protein [Rhodococcus]MCC4306203.1 pyridoxamine 5'-phosphate oxidase family protein [Rhodococcus sp. 3-2]MCC4306694.1 pyridoxamine 5'-phosphate oxidase family protein [Rhodococcus sp. 3-2]